MALINFYAKPWQVNGLQHTYETADHWEVMPQCKTCRRCVSNSAGYYCTYHQQYVASNSKCTAWVQR